MKKKTRSISLLLSPVLSAALMSACGGVNRGASNSNGTGSTSSTVSNTETTQTLERDVYKSQADCLKDWNTGELCQPMNDEDERAYQQRYGVRYRVYWGPHYYPDDRTVIYQGRTIAPVTHSSSIPNFEVTPSSSQASKTSVSSPRSSTTTTGGFGDHGTTSSSTTGEHTSTGSSTTSSEHTTSGSHTTSTTTSSGS